MEAPPPQLGAPRHAQRTLLGSLPGLNGSCPASHSTVAVCRHHSSTQARPSAGRAELGGPGRSSPHCTCRPRSPVRRAAVGRPEAEYRTRERGQFSPCSGTQPVRGFHTGQKNHHLQQADPPGVTAGEGHGPRGGRAGWDGRRLRNPHIPRMPHRREVCGGHTRARATRTWDHCPREGPSPPVNSRATGTRTNTRTTGRSCFSCVTISANETTVAWARAAGSGRQRCWGEGCAALKQGTGPTRCCWREHSLRDGLPPKTRLGVRQPDTCAALCSKDAHRAPASPAPPASAAAPWRAVPSSAPGTPA